MPRNTPRFLFALLLFLGPVLVCSAPARAELPVIDVDNAFSELNLSDQVEVYNDLSGSLSFSQVKALPENAWVRTHGNAISFGFTDHTYWLRFAVRNHSGLELLLQAANPEFDELTAFIEGPMGTERVDTGMAVAPGLRPVLHRHHLVPLPNSEELRIWIRAKNVGAFYLPLRLWHEADFLDQDGVQMLAFGAYFGAMVIVVLINAIAFAVLRNPVFLSFIAFICCFATYQWAMLGIGANALWEIANLYRSAIVYAIAGAIVTGYLLFSTALNLRQYSPTGNTILRAMAGLTVLAILAFGLIGFQTTAAILATLAVPAATTIILICLKLTIEGHRFAAYALVGCSTMLAGSSVHALTRLNLVQLNFPVEHAMFLGVLIMVLTLSGAFAAEFRQRNLEQAAANRRQRERESDRQIQINQELEQKVRSRTSELEAALKELSEANETLKELNTVDQVTGVKNRYYFDTVFAQEWKRASREGYPLSLLMLDIDHFKQVNDTWGHVTGDACLKAVAGRISDLLKRPADILARFGGEEFVILLPYVENQNAEHLAEQIRLSIAASDMVLEEQQISVQVSIGLSTVIPTDDDEPKDLIAAADLALYEAKGNGRNQVSNAGMLQVHTNQAGNRLS